MEPRVIFDFSTPEKAEETRQRMREECRLNLYFLCTYVLGMDKLVSGVHGCLAKFMDSIPIPGWSRREDVLVMLPRDWYKSSVCTIGKTMQNIIRNPGACTLIVNEKLDNAKNFLRAIRKAWEGNRTLRWLFPELIPEMHRVRWSDLAIEMKRPAGYDRPEGTVEVIGVDGTVVSRHYDVIILDDLIGKDAQQSPILMEQARNWIKLAENLFVDSKKGQMCVVGTRWLQDDIYRDLMDDQDLRTFIVGGELDDPSHEAWTKLKNFDRSIRFPGTHPGIPVFPEQFPREELDRLRKKQGPFLYSLMTLLNPISPENAEFKGEWLNYYETDATGGKVIPFKDGSPLEGLKRSDMDVCTMVDPATDSKLAQSRTAVLTAGKDHKGRVFLLEAWAKRGASPSDVVGAIITHFKRYSPRRIGFESVSFFSIYRDFVRKEAHDRGVALPIVPRNPLKEGTKDGRIASLAGLFASGDIFVPRGMKNFIDEYTAFPMSQQKDLLDALWYLVEPSRDGLLRYPDGRRAKEEDSSWHDTQLERYLGRISPITGYGG